MNNIEAIKRLEVKREILENELKEILGSDISDLKYEKSLMYQAEILEHSYKTIQEYKKHIEKINYTIRCLAELESEVF